MSSSLSLEEKVSLLSGFDNWHTQGIKKHKIPKIKMYVLEPDLKARGLDKSSLINNIGVIDYQGFVKLAVENEKIQNWL